MIGLFSESVDPQLYFVKLNQILKEDGNAPMSNCLALKMQAADGKMR